MGAGHSHPLHHHGHSAVHHLAPEAKVLGAFLVVLAVALTPPDAAWAFALHAAVLLSLVAVARLPVRFVVTRVAVVLPFLTFAAFLPFIGEGERTEVLGMALSRDGLVSGGAIAARALLGVTASVVLAGTTSESRILVGLERLRVPRTLTMIATFMLRYLDVLANELSRMRTAMTARGYDPRWLWQAKPIATSAGALFVRGYERGERVHAAMLSRGFTGTMPAPSVPRASTGQWAAVAAVVAVSAAITTTAVVVA